MAKRYELSDASWELIKDLVSPEQKMGRPRSDDRLVLHAILWILNTKIHMICDANGVPLRFILSPGQTSDITHAQPLLDQVRIPGKPGRSTQTQSLVTG